MTAAAKAIQAYEQKLFRQQIGHAAVVQFRKLRIHYPMLDYFVLEFEGQRYTVDLVKHMNGLTGHLEIRPEMPVRSKVVKL